MAGDYENHLNLLCIFHTRGKSPSNYSVTIRLLPRDFYRVIVGEGAVRVNNHA